MAVPFMPDQREGNGQLFSLRFVNGNGKRDQLPLVEVIIVMAVVRSGGDIVMTGLGRHKHRLFEARQAHGDGALTSHLLENFIKRPGVAAFPEDADMGVAQEALQISLFQKCRMVLAQIDARTVAKQDFVVDKPRHQFQQFP